MKEYKRFTHNPDNLEIASPCYLCKHKEERPIRNKQKCSMKECDYLKCYEKLAELEDKIENGTLIELPCKVGTTLYFIYNRPLADKPVLTPKIHETKNWYFDIDEKGVAILARNPYGYNGEYFYYLGEMVFLTKAEAEQRLKELNI